MQCGLSLHLPSSLKFEQEPLGLLQIPNFTSKMLYLGLTCQYVSISAFISDLCHNYHRISIIGVIDVINVRGIQPSVHETPLWLFLSPCKLQFIPNQTYEVYVQVYQPYNISKNIILPIYSNLQEKDTIYIGILASVGPIVSMCLHAPLPLPFYLVFI